MKEEPRVPSAYRLVTLGRRDDVVETARSLARGGAEVTGTFVGVDQHGRLEFDTDGGRRTIEVYQAAAEPPQTET